MKPTKQEREIIGIVVSGLLEAIIENKQVIQEAPDDGDITVELPEKTLKSLRKALK